MNYTVVYTNTDTAGIALTEAFHDLTENATITIFNQTVHPQTLIVRNQLGTYE